MFERLRTFWHRLTRRTNPERTMSNQDERRVWVRHPAELPTTVEPAGVAVGQSLPGLVRDISQGGIKLEIDQPFEEGDLLTVGLVGPAGHSPLTVLACVVHCAPAGAGRWSLGCSFAQELSDADLRAFGAARTPSASDDPDEQRAYQRYRVNVEAHYEVVPSDVDIPPRPALVSDISATGLGLIVDEDLPAGTLLNTELKGAGKPFRILACVVRVIDQDNGQKLVGCSFIRELTEADLRGLL